MMYNPGDDDAGESSAVKSKIQPMRPSDQVIATQVVTILIVIGAALVLVALGGQTLTNDGMKSRTVCFWQAWITGSSLTETTVSTQGEPLRFW